MKTLLKDKLYVTDHIDFDWQKFHHISSSSCSCVTVETDLESYVELKFKNSDCILNIENFLINNRLKVKEKIKRDRSKISVNLDLFFDNLRYIQSIPQEHDIPFEDTVPPLQG